MVATGFRNFCTTVTAFAFPSSNIAYSWAGRRMTQRVHNGNVSFDTGFYGFGERITHTGTGPNGVFHTETLERDVLGRVRSQTHGSQAWNGQERWQGYEYDARHALSTSWEAWAPSSTAPSVGSHDTATNLSVASAAGGLGATASARERAPTLGSLQKIVQGAQDVWEAQRTATGHRLSEISDSNATWMIEHDPLGRVTAALDKEYEYDPLGKLVLARDTNGDLLESYLMTADGRIAQIQRHDAQGYTASMLAYDGAQMTASFTEGTSGTWTQDWQAVWGPGQDQLLEFHDFHNGKTFAVAQDHRNNVVALLDDATGRLDRVMHYTPEGLSTHYDDAGQVLCDEEASLVVTCTELNMPFGFNGMWRSNTTGLSHMRNRWYSTQLGQFMSHDPLEYIDSYDLYAFAKLDPINFWDLWGLSGGSLAAAQAGAKVGQKKKETPAIPDDDDDDPKLDPIDRVNPAEKSMIYFYLAFKADQRQRDDYWTENQDEKFGDLMPEGTRYECTAVCSLGLVVGIFSSVAETIGIATAGAALGVAGGKAAAKRIKPTRVKPCSFVEDTPVLMCDGTLKSIVDVEIGDSVLARSKLTGEIECREVMNLSEPAERSIILVTLESMDGMSEVIAATENHPFFVEGLGWTRVDDLVPGDLVPSATNGLLTVSALEWTDRLELVYNFGVDEFHTYFVGEVGAWVHNCFYNSIKDAPAYPKDFVKGKLTKHNVKDKELLNDVLRKEAPGEWNKVYLDGKSGAESVSVHYFQHAKTGKVFNVKVKPGHSNK